MTIDYSEEEKFVSCKIIKILNVLSCIVSLEAAEENSLQMDKEKFLRTKSIFLIKWLYSFI